MSLAAWFVRHSTTRDGARLFCFPYAGGNPYLFREWPPLLGYPVELFAIQSPGKGSRVMERPCTSVAQLVDGLLQAIVPKLHERPFSFFGHSNGALIAFELACQLQQRGLPLPGHLFLSASPAPWARTYERSYANMSEDEFRNVLRDMEGTPEEILADVELFRLVLPGIRADFSLGETYRFDHGRPLDVPATLFHGERDNIAEWQMLAWRDQLRDDAPMIRLPGGHFFLHSHLRELATLVGAQLRATHGATARVLPG